MKTNQAAIIAAAILIVAVIGGIAYLYYSTLPQPVDVAALRAYADPMTANILQSINTGNYANFSANFDSVMKSSINQTAFDQLCSLLSSKVGNYTSMEFVKGESLQGNVIAYYLANFTEEPAGVTVKVVFDTGNPIQITGLWFDSPKLDAD
jgi:hypothetical protein